MVTQFFSHEVKATACVIPSFPFMESGGKINDLHKPPVMENSKIVWFPTRSSSWWALKAHSRVPSLPQLPGLYPPLAFAGLDPEQPEEKKKVLNLQAPIIVPQDALLLLSSHGCWSSSPPPAVQSGAEHSWSGFVPKHGQRRNKHCLQQPTFPVD